MSLQRLQKCFDPSGRRNPHAAKVAGSLFGAHGVPSNGPGGMWARRIADGAQFVAVDVLPKE
ncbi:hypothetical protein EBT31_22570 [bacterium]|nr:hypothetical protein [bacterium]